jgi:hypothetical protein
MYVYWSASANPLGLPRASSGSFSEPVHAYSRIPVEYTFIPMEYILQGGEKRYSERMYPHSRCEIPNFGQCLSSVSGP